MLSALRNRAILFAGLALLCSGCAVDSTSSTARYSRFDFSPGRATSLGAGDFVGCQVYANQNPGVLASLDRHDDSLAELDTGD